MTTREQRQYRALIDKAKRAGEDDDRIDELRSEFNANPPDEDDEDEQAGCGICGGELVPLGSLASRLHLRCRNCGANFSRGATE